MAGAREIQAARIGMGAAIVLGALAAAASGTLAHANDKPAVAVIANLDDPSEFNAAAFSPNGALVAVSNGAYTTKYITLWDMTAGRPLRRLSDPAFFTAVLFTPDGASLASGHKDGAVKLWDVATGVTTTLLPGKSEDDSIRSLWIDDKGEFLVSGNEAGLVTVFNIAQRKPVGTFSLAPVDSAGNRPAIVAARLSADASRVIALSHDGVNSIDSAQVWDARAGASIASVKLPKGYAFAESGMLDEDAFIVRIAREGCGIDRLVQFSLRDPANFIDVLTPAQCSKPETEGLSDGPKIFPAAIGALALIAQGGDSDLRLWDAQTHRVERTIQWPDAAAKGLIGVGRDLKLAATSEKDKLRIRDVETGAPTRELAAYGYPAENAILGKDGRSIILSHEQGETEPKHRDITLWKVDALGPRTTPLAASGVSLIYDVSLEAALALGGNDKGEVFLFSTETGREQTKFSLAGFKSIEKANLSPDGKLMLVLGEQANGQADDTRDIAVLAGTSDGKIIRSFASRDPEARDQVMSVAFSPDGKRFAIGRRNGTAEIWSTQTARRIKMLAAPKGDDSDTWSLAFSPDGQRLVGSSLFNETVFIWSAGTGRVVRSFDLGESRAHYRHAAAVAMSRDSKLVAAGLAQRAVSSGDVGPERGGITVWDAASGKLRFTLRGHHGAVFALTFSPDDRRIISGSLDGTIRYWDRTDGRWLATFAPTPEGRWIVLTGRGFFAGSADGGALINLVRGLQSVSAAQLRDQLSRPDLVEQLLKGDPAHRYRDAALDLDKLFDAALSSGERPR
jgi:WD40 repeat protein